MKNEFYNIYNNTITQPCFILFFFLNGELCVNFLTFFIRKSEKMVNEKYKKNR